MATNSTTYIHPSVSSTITDNSTTYVTADGTTKLFAVFTSEKGPDNVIKEISTVSEYEFYYGEPNMKLYGQAGYNIVNWLNAGGSVYCLRVLPDDAGFANAIINIQTKVTTKKVISVTGDLVTVPDVSLRPVVSYTSINNVSEDSVEFDELRRSTTKTIDGYKNNMLLAVIPKGRGKGYNDLGFRIALTDTYDNTYDFRVYSFEVTSTGTTGSVSSIEGPFYVSFDPDAVNNSGTSMFITDVINKYCNYFKIIFEESNYEELGSIINPNVNPNKIDFFNGITRVIDDTTETYYDPDTKKNEDVHMYITKYDDNGNSLGIKNIVDSDSEVEMSILDVDNSYRQELYRRALTTLNIMKDSLSQFRKGKDSKGKYQLAVTIEEAYKKVNKLYTETLKPTLLDDTTKLYTDIIELDSNVSNTNYSKLSNLSNELVTDIVDFIDLVVDVVGYCRINPTTADVTLISTISTILDSIATTQYSINQKQLTFNRLLSNVTDIKSKYIDVFTNSSNNNTDKEGFIAEFLDYANDIIETLTYSDVKDATLNYTTDSQGKKIMLVKEDVDGGDPRYYYTDSNVTYEADTSDKTFVYETVVGDKTIKLTYNSETSKFQYVDDTNGETKTVDNSLVTKKVYVAKTTGSAFTFGDKLLSEMIKNVALVDSEYEDIIKNEYTSDLDYNESMQKVSSYLNTIINGTSISVDEMTSISDAINLIQLEATTQILITSISDIKSVYNNVVKLVNDTLELFNNDTKEINTAIITSKISTYDSTVKNAKLQNTYDLALQNYDNNVQLLYGNDGSIEDKSVDNTAVVSLLVKGYKGEIDDTLLDKEIYPIDVILDANYPASVKTAIVSLVTDIRGDFIGILDTRCQATPLDSIDFRKSSISVSDYKISIFAQDFTVIDDEYTQAKIQVTTPYFLASKIPSNDNNNGIQWNFVGPRRGVISGYEEISYVPNPTWKEALYKAQVNYVEKDTTSTRLGSQLTSQTTVSALSNLNNVRTLLRIQRDVENLMKNFIFEWNDNTTISEAQLSLNSYLNQWTTNRACTSITGTVYSSDYDKLQKLLRVKIEMVFNSVIERIAIDLTVNS